jgi:hypothetical protein
VPNVLGLARTDRHDSTYKRSSVNVVLARADVGGMSIACPIRGCSGTLQGYSFKSQVMGAAQFQPFIDMLNRLADIWDTDVWQAEFAHVIGSAEEIRQLAADGGEIMEGIHACAHRVLADSNGASFQSAPVKLWKAWKDAATPWCLSLSVVDRDWCVDYWSEQMREGVKIPLELRSGLRQTEVIR